MTTAPLVVVAPVYNEAAILPELARRCLTAARAVDPAAIVLLVDDASTDATRSLASVLPDGVRLLHLPTNRGQLGATLAGLATVSGDGDVVVIDGDLQDPPEHLPALVAALRADPTLDVVFATKTSRQDPWWLHVGRAGYVALLTIGGAHHAPSGAGAYCALRTALARRAVGARVERANLAPLLMALGARAGSVPYAKQARYDGASRVGAMGLVAEAVASLRLSGAARRLCLGAAAVTAGAALLLPVAAPWLLVLAGGMLVAGLLLPPLVVEDRR